MSTPGVNDNRCSHSQLALGDHDTITGRELVPVAIPVAEFQAVVDFATASKAVASKRGYVSDWDYFAAWATGCGFNAYPASPDAVCLYLANLEKSGLKASTIRRRLAAITHKHRILGFEAPTSTEAVRSVMSGIRRELGVRPEHTKRAYAWFSPIEGSSKRRFHAVLHLPPITSAQDAVRAAIVADHKVKS